MLNSIFNFLRKNAFVFLLLIVFCIVDVYFLYNDPFIYSDVFPRDDFDVTKLQNPQEEWDKVFFGNSDVIAGYNQELSTTDYVNLGLDCGVVTDLEKMLDKKLINVKQELVVGLDYLALYDDFDTNPSYAWHKKWYEPYFYFERDKLYGAVDAALKRVFYSNKLQSALNYYHYPREKTVYVGNLSKEEIDIKIEKYTDMFFGLPDSAFDDNIKSIANVADYCNENGITMKVVFMPWNPDFEEPELFSRLEKRVIDALQGKNVAIFDLTDAVQAQYFHDTSHIEFNNGAKVFTELFDKIMMSQGETGYEVS